MCTGFQWWNKYLLMDCPGWLPSCLNIVILFCMGGLVDVLHIIFCICSHGKLLLFLTKIFWNHALSRSQGRLSDNIFSQYSAKRHCEGDAREFKHDINTSTVKQLNLLPRLLWAHPKSCLKMKIFATPCTYFGQPVKWWLCHHLKPIHGFSKHIFIGLNQQQTDVLDFSSLCLLK